MPGIVLRADLEFDGRAPNQPLMSSRRRFFARVHHQGDQQITGISRSARTCFPASQPLSDERFLPTGRQRGAAGRRQLDLTASATFRLGDRRNIRAPIFIAAKAARSIRTAHQYRRA